MKCSFCKNDAVDSIHVKNKDFDFCYGCQLEALAMFVDEKTTERTCEIMVGDMIEVPTWGTIGCVVNVRNAMTGGESAMDVDLQVSPYTEDIKTFILEDGQFKWV